MTPQEAAAQMPPLTDEQVERVVALLSSYINVHQDETE